ncbi:hypothetical protein BJ875DRAFT_35841 [Amylocarpus encephaloides]|uniref:Uncharacterized protein n=1 Tax=Amylocarpus encephaloides TaxID=45428 RepID=A0A9P7YHI8_9HELO|nr:hypothetical protein BJ875DRAFT_35841 [Amylocarpus encephaloides]
MSDDAGPEPSLFLARHKDAHREHNHDHDHSHSHLNTRRHHNHNHHAHNIVHQALKKRQQSTVVEQVNAVTTVIATVSYVQQIDVDQNGSTFSIERILTSPSSAASAATTTPADQTNPVTVPTAGPSSAASSAQPDSSSQSLLSISSTSQSSLTSSAPSIPVTSSFSSPTVSSNSTITPLISSSSSFSSSTFSNTTSSSSRSSLTYLTYLTSESSASSFSSGSSFSSSSSTPLTRSSFSSSPSAGASSTVVGGGGIVGGESGVASSSAAPSSTETAGNSTSSGSSSPPAGVIAGSVVGSLAGFAFLVLLILFLARWKKRKDMLSLGNGTEAGGSSATRELPPAAPAGGMVERTQRRSSLFAVPAALASLTGYNKRSSRQTEGTLSSTAGSERGFYRVSGRKLPSVLQTGGDGYGTAVPGEANTLSGSSFYRDSTGFYGGHGPTSSSPLAASPAGVMIDRESGVPVMRPSPARTPVTEPGPWPVATPPPLQPPRRPGHPDGLGRSHPSQDGSHASRFTEEV